LLVTTLAAWTALPVVISLMIVVALAFGLVAPNAMSAAMQPLPEIAGSVSAAAGFIQMMVAAGSSALVALLFDGHSALSMAAVMASFSALAAASYMRVVRPRLTASRTCARQRSRSWSDHSPQPDIQCDETVRNLGACRTSVQGSRLGPAQGRPDNRGRDDLSQAPERLTHLTARAPLS
jgi:hypothetical protein